MGRVVFNQILKSTYKDTDRLQQWLDMGLMKPILTKCKVMEMGNHHQIRPNNDYPLAGRKFYESSCDKE